MRIIQVHNYIFTKSITKWIEKWMEKLLKFSLEKKGRRIDQSIKILRKNNFSRRFSTTWIGIQQVAAASGCQMKRGPCSSFFRLPSFLPSFLSSFLSFFRDWFFYSLVSIKRPTTLGFTARDSFLSLG